jgi:phospholipid/cholesterol/gamma-HCH transport system substrate-binding protein
MAKADNLAETGVGAVVIAAAASFLFYAISHAGAGTGSGGYELTARFGDVGTLESGADVRVAGVKVGAVSKVELDPKTFLARVHMTISPGVKLPADSTAKITTSGLLGGPLVSIAPGGAADDMRPGSEFQNTQGSVDLFGLIGSVVKGSGGGSSQPAAPAPAAQSAPSQPASSKAAADPYPG